MFFSSADKLPGGCLLFFSIFARAFTNIFRRIGNMEWFVQTPEHSFKDTFSDRIPLVVFSPRACLSEYMAWLQDPFSCGVVHLRCMMFQTWERFKKSTPKNSKRKPYDWRKRQVNQLRRLHTSWGSPTVRFTAGARNWSNTEKMRFREVDIKRH